MKIDWLVAIVTAVESPDRAEHTILGVILAVRFFRQLLTVCGVGTLSNGYTRSGPLPRVDILELEMGVPTPQSGSPTTNAA